MIVHIIIHSKVITIDSKICNHSIGIVNYGFTQIITCKVTNASCTYTYQLQYETNDISNNKLTCLRQGYSDTFQITLKIYNINIDNEQYIIYGNLGSISNILNISKSSILPEYTKLNVACNTLSYNGIRWFDFPPKKFQETFEKDVNIVTVYDLLISDQVKQYVIDQLILSECLPNDLQLDYAIADIKSYTIDNLIAKITF